MMAALPCLAFLLLLQGFVHGIEHGKDPNVLEPGVTYRGRAAKAFEMEKVDIEEDRIPRQKEKDEHISLKNRSSKLKDGEKSISKIEMRKWQCLQDNDCRKGKYCKKTHGDQGGICKVKWKDFCEEDHECSPGYYCEKRKLIRTAGTCVKDLLCESVHCGENGRCLAGSCHCKFPKIGPRCKESALKTAYATLIFGEVGPSLLMMTRVWARSLRTSGATGDIIVMTPGLSDDIANILKKDRIKIVNVEAISLPLSVRTKEAKALWGKVFTKLKVWTLTNYDVVAFMDVDILVKAESIEDLFSACNVDLCLARDPTDNPKKPMGNVGVMVLRPNEARYTHMIETLKLMRENYRFPEQEWLTRYLRDPINGMKGSLLPHELNTCSQEDSGTGRWTWGWDNGEEEDHNFVKGEDIGWEEGKIKIYHYCGGNKPPFYHYSTTSQKIVLWHQQYKEIDPCWSKTETCQKNTSCVLMQIVKDKKFCIGKTMAKLILKTKDSRIATLSGVGEKKKLNTTPSQEITEAVCANGIKALKNSTVAAFAKSALYQLVTDRFVSSDKERTKCEDLTRQCGGDFDGIRENLDYFVDLGIDAVWMSPVMRNVHPDTCYHGYCPMGVGTELGDQYGGFKAYSKLRSAFKKHGIRVMGDMVLNHIGSNVKDLDKGLLHPNPFGNDRNGPYYHSYKEYGEGKCEYDELNPKQRIRCWIWGLPDLNHSVPFVEKTMISMVQDSIHKFNFDAIRVDADHNIDPRFLSKMRKSIDVIAFGETFDSIFARVGGHQHLLGGATNYPLYYKMRESFIFKKNMGEALQIATERSFYEYRNQANVLNFIENHDSARFLDRRGVTIADYMNAQTTIIMWTGIPVLYYGTELALQGISKYKKRIALDEFMYPDSSRKPLWQSTVWKRTRREGDPPKVYKWIRCLLAIRRAFKIWDKQQETTLKRKWFFSFSRGPVLVIVSNIAHQRLNSKDGVLVNVPHHFAPRTRICNVLPPFQCAVSIKEGNWTRSLPHRIHSNGLPAVYIPMSTRMEKVLRRVLYAQATNIMKMSRNENHKIYEALVVIINDTAVLINKENYRAICLFKNQESNSHMKCIETLKELRGDKGFKLSMAPTSSLETINISLQALNGHITHSSVDIFKYKVMFVDSVSLNYE